VSGYPIASLGEVVQINPRVARVDRASASLPVTFVPMAAVSEKTGSIISPEVRSFSEVSRGFPLFVENDVLFAKITPCMENGKAAIARGLINGAGAGSTECFVLRPTSKILSDFVFHFIRRNNFREICKANFTGTAGQQRVPKSFLEGVQVPVPPLNKQQEIVRFLNRAGQIGHRADAARAKARTIIPALFLDIFGDPANNPKVWPIVTLGEVIGRITGGKNIEAGSGTSEFRILKVSAVTSGIFKPDEAKPAPDGYSPMPDHHVRHGDFLFSRANTSELVGAVAIANNPPAGLLLPDKIWRIDWDYSRIDPQYAYSLLWTAEIRRIFALIGSGTSSSMKNISQAKLLRVAVPLPPIAIQSAFAQQVRRLGALALHLDAAAAKAEAMAAGLSAEVFG
jgi:type I restriction enzyme, S subunit